MTVQLIIHYNKTGPNPSAACEMGGWEMFQSQLHESFTERSLIFPTKVTPRMIPAYSFCEVQLVVKS